MEKIMKDYTNRNLTRQYKLRDKERFVEKSNREKDTGISNEEWRKLEIAQSEYGNNFLNKESSTKQKSVKEETRLPHQDADLEAMNDLYQDAKRSGDNDLALDILDRRLELEAKRETERFFMTQPSAEEMTLKALRKGKDEGDF